MCVEGRKEAFSGTVTMKFLLKMVGCHGSDATGQTQGECTSLAPCEMSGHTNGVLSGLRADLGSQVRRQLDVGSAPCVSLSTDTGTGFFRSSSAMPVLPWPASWPPAVAAGAPMQNGELCGSFRGDRGTDGEG